MSRLAPQATRYNGGPAVPLSWLVERLPVRAGGRFPTEAMR
ncbi:hypothetical protein [Mycolicibacterium baixiangningiae]|nr:hypothetical protein [Mycolicibacterium baixiangningiae]